MDIILLILGIIFLIGGFIGCIAPGLPGPPISYIALLLLEWSKYADYSWTVLLVLAGVVLLVTIMDNVFPIYMTKRFGGSKGGVWGSTIGLIVGFFFGLPGIILGPFLGALIGELIAGKQAQIAVKSAFGAFVGFIFGTGAKLISCGVITYYFVTALF